MEQTAQKIYKMRDYKRQDLKYLLKLWKTTGFCEPAGVDDVNSSYNNHDGSGKLFPFLLLFLIFILSLSYELSASSNPWEKWDSVTIAKANTAAAIDYLTEQEKLVILLTNLARFDGTLFAETFLKTYLENRSQTKYSRSLVRDLKKVKEFQALYPEQDLFEVAQGHALKSGKSGHTGHKDFDKRFKPLLGKYNLVAENCAYGLENAIDNVIQLLIDENVSDLGHRKNMLNPVFNSTGVSIQPHKKFNFNCVIGYGRNIKIKE